MCDISKLEDFIYDEDVAILDSEGHFISPEDISIDLDSLNDYRRYYLEIKDDDDLRYIIDCLSYNNVIVLKGILDENDEIIYYAGYPFIVVYGSERILIRCIYDDNIDFSEQAISLDSFCR